MHEFGIMSRIVDAAVRAARRHGVDRVARVDLVVGRLTFLDLDQARLAYSMLIPDTPLSGSELCIQETPGRVTCVECGEEREIDCPRPDDLRTHSLPPFTCAACGGSVRITGGRECVVAGIYAG